jgi:hypothetical protein
MSECRVLCLKSALRLDGETNRVRKKQSSAIIPTDVRRFGHVINKDGVFGTHTHFLSENSARIAPASSKRAGALKQFKRIALREDSPELRPFVALARAPVLIKSVHRASESPRIWVKIIQISVTDEVLRRHSPFAGFHSSESVQHPDFYRYQESYPRRNGSQRNCCSRADDERSAVPVSV